MSISYSLHLQTKLSMYQVLEVLFNPKNIEKIVATEMLYVRGTVFLAHARITEPSLGEKLSKTFGIEPTVSIAYFPDGVSSFQTALNHLVDTILQWLRTQDDNLLLLANKAQLVLKQFEGMLTLDPVHSFWTSNRLERINLPYQTIS